MTATNIYNRYYWLYLRQFTMWERNENYDFMQDRIKRYTIRILHHDNKCNPLLIKSAAARAARNFINGI